MNDEYRILQIDPYLEPFKDEIEMRMNRYHAFRNKLAPHSQLLSSIANDYLYYGFHETDGGWVYREWAPNAQEISLFGDFNNWNEQSHKLTRIGGDNWELYVNSLTWVCT